MVQADGVRPIGQTGAEHAGKRLAHVVVGMRNQLVTSYSARARERWPEDQDMVMTHEELAVPSLPM
jgi:hypothetical protein